MRILIVCFLVTLVCILLQGQNADPLLLQHLMKQNPNVKIAFDRRNTYEIQILYTQINRDENNKPNFQTFQFNIDTTKYFYPASTVKFPVALLALEKLNELNVPGVTIHTPMYHDSVYSGQSWVKVDTTAEGGVATIEHYIKKLFVVSDNDAFNRLYEFVGQRRINDKLKEKGYRLRILHRLNRKATPDENRHTEVIRFADRDTVYYAQPMLVNDSMIVRNKTLKGRGYYEEGKLIRKPLNFSYKNFFSIPDQHKMLKAFIFPESVPASERFNLTGEERNLVLKYMSQLPTETLYPPYYKDTTYVDAYSKLFMYGSERTPIPNNIRIFNKLGVAYGYSIDNAYIVDFDAGVEFLLTAVVYTNKNQTFNDDNYEYWTTGFPFLRDLGNLIYNYEKSRPKKYLPDLSEFRIDYDLKREEYK